MKFIVKEPIFAESASRLVNVAAAYPETVLLKKGHWTVDAKSLLGVIALSLKPGETVNVEMPDGENDSFFTELEKTGLFEKTS